MYVLKNVCVKGIHAEQYDAKRCMVSLQFCTSCVYGWFEVVTAAQHYIHFCLIRLRVTRSRRFVKSFWNSLLFRTKVVFFNELHAAVKLCGLFLIIN